MRRADQLGDRLIFLISQPRSGSTLLQKLLARHPKITSLPEPWFMLQFVYAMRQEGIAAQYNARNASRGLTDFIEALPAGRETYITAVRQAAMTLYGAALRSADKELFLDKTPRYYLIIPEIIEIFPSASYLFLVRDPLDVFTSILEAHAGGDWSGLAREDRLHDLITAPNAILEATSSADVKHLLIRYEDLVQDPLAQMELIGKTMGLDFDPAVLEYDPVDSSRKPLGDRRGIHRHARPVTDYVSTWQRRLDTGWKRELASCYLRHLGPETVNGLGFNYSALEESVSNAASRFGIGSRRWRIISTPPRERNWRDTLLLALARSRHERGVVRTGLRSIYIASGARSRKLGTPDGVTGP